MKSITLHGTILLVSISLFVSTRAQVRDGSQIQSSINSRVSPGGNDTLRYRYRISVLPNSPQRLIALTIEVGLRLPSDALSVTVDSIRTRHWGGSIAIPTACPIPFRGAEVTWTSLDSLTRIEDQLVLPSSAIAQNDSLVVTISSRGLPCIARYWGRGWYPPIREGEFDTLQALGYTDSEILKPWYNVAKIGWIVAPNYQGIPSSPIVFLDSMSGDIATARSLGWISNQSTADKYSNFINTIKSQLQTSNIPGARLSIQTVLNEVNNDSSSALSSECYALIRYKTEFLRDMLKP